MNWLTLVLETLKSLFNFAEKVTPSDEYRQDKLDIKKPRLEQSEKIAIFNREFRRLKDHPELSIETNVNFVADNMNEEDQKELLELLTARITSYRKKRPIIFRKWLKENNLN